MDLRPANRLVDGVSLGLHVDAVQPERVLADDSVDASVTGGTRPFHRAGSPVTHRLQKSDNQIFKPGGRQRECLLQDLPLDGCPVLRKRSVDEILG
ncbi:Uncharacterised protein [Mycobacterium tuberculosis]|nr:Uncharacterised protein [Mycobacterium tuberculosis]